MDAIGLDGWQQQTGRLMIDIMKFLYYTVYKEGTFHSDDLCDVEIIT